MAKKRKKPVKRTGGRRRGRSRVGALGIPMEQLGGFAAGALGSKMSNVVTSKVGFLTKNKFIVPGLKLAAGYFAIAKSRNPFVQGLGAGVISEGVLHLLGAVSPETEAKWAFAPAVSGIGTTYIDLDDPISGYGFDGGVAGMGEDFKVAGGAI